MEMAEGRFVAPVDALFTLVDPNSTTVNAYATDAEREKITGGDAIFISEYRTTKIERLALTRTAETGNTDIPWPELASTYGGPIASDIDADGVLTGRRTLYEIVAEAPLVAPDQAMRGYLKIQAPPDSLFSIGINKLVSVLRREGKV